LTVCNHESILLHKKELRQYYDSSKRKKKAIYFIEAALVLHDRLVPWFLSMKVYFDQSFCLAYIA